MAKAKVIGINILTVADKLNGVLSFLQKEGSVQLNTINDDHSYFKEADVRGDLDSINGQIKTIGEAIDVLNKYSPGSRKGIIKDRERISQSSFMRVEEQRQESVKLCGKIISLNNQIQTKKAEIIDIERKAEYLKNWAALNVPTNIKSTKTTEIFIGSVDTADFNPGFPCVTEVIKACKNYNNIFLLCLKEDSSSAAELLSRHNFIPFEFNSPFTPRQQLSHCENKISTLKKEIERAEKYIFERCRNLDRLKLLYEFLSSKAVFVAGKGKALNSSCTSTISGYIRQKDFDSIQKRLYKYFGAYCESFVEASPPVILENDNFSSPIETVLETYSLPSSEELDPTPYMSVFYYVFFGMMLSDWGYGIVMSLACGFLLLKYRYTSDSLRKNLKMFFICGLSTVFWGIMFGSFFGDAVGVISKTFFGIDNLYIPGVTVPLWFSPVEKPMKLLLVSFLFGIIHIYTGLCLKGVMLYQKGKYIDIVYDVASWLLLVSGGVTALMATDIFRGISGFMLPRVYTKIGGISALLGAFIILVFSGRGTTAVKRALKGFYGLYSVTSYLSDILSYSRLLALGLATGVIAQVFNQIGSMFGSGVTGALLFTAVFLIGHSLNMGINALGAYVHTNRLEFVEFFGKFYSGGGRKFKPFSYDSKSYIITEG